MQITHSSLIHQKISLALNMRVTLSLINLFIYCFIYLLQFATIVTICNNLLQFVTIYYNCYNYVIVLSPNYEDCESTTHCVFGGSAALVVSGGVSVEGNESFTPIELNHHETI